MNPTVSATVAQFPVSLDISANMDHLLSIIYAVEEQTLVVTPEGSVSGYSQDSIFLEQIDTILLEQAIEKLRDEAAQRQLHLVVGSCIQELGNWYNAALYFGPRKEFHVYRKINLATSERGFFKAGNELPAFSVVIHGLTVSLGIQMCREIRYPEQWRYLAHQGAQVFAFLNNAVGDSEICPIWRSHLVSRAAETQRFIIAANNAASDQKCPTMIINPSGKVLFEVVSPHTAMGNSELNLLDVSNSVFTQARTDVIRFSR
ncbi:carbon-nitrogen hydrolase family protein [Nostoc sp. FACHB-973]|nr:carbon-nitrogen hydrolase family protein [Nostoc sp. FACHB-973]